MKKKVTFKLVILVLFLSLSSCAELASTLSNFNQQNGSQCRYYTCTIYMKEDGKWRNGMVNNKDRAWAKRLQSSYLSYGKFEVYYKTSTRTGIDYKFSVYCSSYY